MKFTTRIKNNPLPYKIFILNLISFLSIGISSIKLNKFTLEVSEGKDILKKIINYDEIKEKLSNADFIKSLINDNKKQSEIESYFNKYPKDKLIEISSSQDNKIKSFINQVKQNSSDLKKVLDMTVDFLANHEEIKNVLIKNKKYYMQYLNESDKLNTANQMRFHQSDIIGIEDLPPPMPYMSLDTPCMTPADCTAKKLLWMKCTVLRVGIRTAYEGINIALNATNKALFGLCACVQIPMGPDKLKCQCNNTNAQPGLACTIPNQVFKGIFKISVQIWKAYQMISHTCFSPINPLL